MPEQESDAKELDSVASEIDWIANQFIAFLEREEFEILEQAQEIIRKIPTRKESAFAS